LTLQLGEEYLPSSARSSKAFCDGNAPMALTTALNGAHRDAAAQLAEPQDLRHASQLFVASVVSK